MVQTLDMKTLRYLNLFNKITRVHTRFCFMYNETLFFCVPKQLLSQAIGEGGRNVRKINEITNKRVKIVINPLGLNDAKRFVTSIVSPVEFKDLTLEGDEINITAGRNNKAALIGRNKRRFLEMQRIVHDFFGKGFKIS